MKLTDPEVQREVLSVCQTGRLPELRLPEDRPVLPQDCVGHTDKVIKCLERCLVIFDSESEGLSKQDLKAVAVPVLLLCGEQADASGPWTSAQSIALSFALLAKLKAVVFQEDSLRKILTSGTRFGLPAGQLVRWAVADLAPRVDKDSLRRHPAAVFCCVWLLHQLWHPHLAEFVGFFLPFSLCLLGDWQEENKLRGVQCLLHLVEHLGSSDLTWYGRGDLLQSSLDPYVSSVSSAHGDVRVLDAALGTYRELLDKTESAEKGPDSASDTCAMNGRERLASKVLRNLEVESRHDVKKVLSEHVLLLIPSLGVRMARWMARMTQTCEAILGAPLTTEGEDSCKRNLLNALHLTLSDDKVPLASAYVTPLLKCLFRLLYEASKREKDWDFLSEDILKCLGSIREKQQELFSADLRGMQNLKVNSRFDGACSELF